ncbi:MAG: hypothetical protein NTX06_08435 [Proteobacteria bacterium]|nr:hypothetical protein [Pseudomonadota bacterium]
MSIKQVDRLYRKMIVYDSACTGRINSGVRSDLFHVIMDDIERLQKKVVRLHPESEKYRALDHEIRKLLLKEIQIIIDDYMISQQHGTLDLWHRMYGDIKYYVQHFYLYSKGELAEPVDSVMNKYGFYMDDETRT